MLCCIRLNPPVLCCMTLYSAMSSCIILYDLMTPCIIFDHVMVFFILPQCTIRYQNIAHYTMLYFTVLSLNNRILYHITAHYTMLYYYMGLYYISVFRIMLQSSCSILLYYIVIFILDYTCMYICSRVPGHHHHPPPPHQWYPLPTLWHPHPHGTQPLLRAESGNLRSSFPHQT